MEPSQIRGIRLITLILHADHFSPKAQHSQICLNCHRHLEFEETIAFPILYADKVRYLGSLSYDYPSTRVRRTASSNGPLFLVKERSPSGTTSTLSQNLLALRNKHASMISDDNPMAEQYPPSKPSPPVEPSRQRQMIQTTDHNIERANNSRCEV